MRHYNIPWSFYFEYNQSKKELKLHLSDQLKADEDVDQSEFLIEADAIENYIHKYDLRKLDYFFKKTMKHSFDTIIRLKKYNGKKGYIKTHALCYITKDQMHCITVKQIDVIKAKKSIDKYQLQSDVKINILVSPLDDVVKDINVSGLERHLQRLMFRDYSI